MTYTYTDAAGTEHTRVISVPAYDVHPVTGQATAYPWPDVPTEYADCPTLADLDGREQATPFL